MASLFDTFREGLQEGARLSPSEAERIAVCVIEWGADAGHAGVEFYWPAKVRSMPVAERNRAIKEEFNGSNLRAICERYQVSRATVYNVIQPRG